MNREQANTLVRQTFTQAFDKAGFQNFTLNLLNHLDESKAAPWNSQYVKDAFKSHVQRYERLGTYTSPEKDKLDVLIVHLTHESKLERARTAIRNFVADHLKTRDEKDAALVAFVSPSETTWRFSYVKMEYATVEKDSGQVGVETRLTPARRFSYIVGEGESCHTAQTRFLGLLQDTKTDPTLADIEEAFSVEAVTKEFFKKYAELFGEIHEALDKVVAKDKPIHDEFTAKGVNTVDFAKKLMGQIVFLYFIQKKGWLGVGKGQDWGSGPRDFLRRLANGEYGRYNNFFNDILEPLFYDTLATDRGHAAWCNRFNCRMPFLNGGLFEPLGDYDWLKTDILLPNKLFTNSEFVEEGITGSGVLDVFDRYNFTVNEAEPLEIEVAIDPEMLGKVFENLIEDNRRKGLGAYYTPREIVHYMCQESLINYLDTAINPAQTFEVSETSKVLVPRADLETFVHLGEQISHYEAVETEYRIKMPDSIQAHARLMDDKLAEITICDPAVGSGAFPVGMMTEIVHARCALTPYFNAVGERTPYQFKRHAIQNCLYGVDIDPGAVEIAKLRLWLSLVVDEEDVKRIKPLPNLDYKIVVGNSLLGFPFKSQRVGEIEKLKARLFDETDHAKKAQLKAQVDRLLAEVFAASKRSLGYEVNFDFEIFFSEVFQRKGGFDVVVANPPYLKERDNKQVFSQINSSSLGRKHHQGKMDYWYYFLHRAIDIVRTRGHIAYITSRYWINSAGATKLITRIRDEMSFVALVDIGKLKVFDNVVGQHMVAVYRKTKDVDEFTYKRLSNDLSGINSQHDTANVSLRTLLNSSVVSESSEIRFDVDQVRWQGTVRLGEVCDVSQGVVEAPDKLSRKQVENTDRKDVRVGDGVFVLSRDEYIHMSLTEEEKRLLVPYLDPSDVLRYWVKPDAGKYLIYADKPARAAIATRKEYRTIKKHLDRFCDFITSSNGPYGLHRPRNARYLTSPKILFKNMFVRPEFALDMDRRFVGFSFSCIIQMDRSFDLRYILALLNSGIGTYWFEAYGKRRGAGLDIGVGKLRLFPIRKASKEEQGKVITRVDKIVDAKVRDPKADTTAWEREIDQLVYQLYGLTPEEIAVVEASTRAK